MSKQWATQNKDLHAAENILAYYAEDEISTPLSIFEIILDMEKREIAI